MQKQQTSIALALVLASVLVADAQTNWSDRKTYTTLGAERVVVPEEVEKVFGVVYFKEHVKRLFGKLPSPSLNPIERYALKMLKDNGYVFVPVRPALVNTIEEPWLVMREPIPDSFFEDWQAHDKRARGQKRMPTSDEVLWFTEVLWRVRGKELFKYTYVRTSTSFEYGVHVCLGQNQEGVLKSVSCSDTATFVETNEGRVPIALAPVAKR